MSKPRLLRALAFTAVLAVATALLLGRWPIRAEGLGRHVWNLGHVGLFALITIGLRMALPAGRRGWAIPVALAFALGSEVVQRLVGRDSSYADLANNALGVSIGWFICGGWRERRWRVPVLAAILIGCALSITPWVKVLVARSLVMDSFPVIGDAERPIERSLWEPTSGANLRFEERGGATGGTCVAMAMWGGRGWPGVTLRHPQTDWSEFSEVTFSARSKDAPDAKLGIALKGAERRSRSVDVTSDWADYRVPIPPELAGEIRAIVFYIAAEWGPSMFQIDDIRLR